MQLLLVASGSSTGVAYRDAGGRLRGLLFADAVGEAVRAANAAAATGHVAGRRRR
jgi:hypothetical protein